MTKKDYDFICYIIDKNTVNVAGKYEDYKKINFSYSMIGIWFKYQKFNKASISEDEFIIESFDFTQKGYQEMIDYVNSKEFKAFIYSLGVGD